MDFLVDPDQEEEKTKSMLDYVTIMSQQRKIKSPSEYSQQFEKWSSKDFKSTAKVKRAKDKAEELESYGDFYMYLGEKQYKKF